MTDKYAVAAGGNWGDITTWSLSSGGVGGAPVPLATDNVFLDAASGNVVINVSATCADFVCTGYTGTLSGNSGLSQTGGAFMLAAGMTLTYTGTFTFTGANAVGDVTLTRAGQTSSQSYSFSGVGEVFKLADDHSIGPAFTLVNGTLDTQGFDVTCNSFNYNNSNTKTLNLAGSNIFVRTQVNGIVTGTTWVAPDVVRVTRSTTSPPTTAFITGGQAFKKVEISRAPTATVYGFTIDEGAGSLSIEWLEFIAAPNANWIGCQFLIPSDITIDKCAFPEGIEIISSVNGTQRTITTSTNEISFDGCMIRDIVISGGPAYAVNSADLGNNSGITFNNFGATTHSITGVTYDDAGVALPSCLVIAYKDDAGESKEAGRVTSDAVTGAYVIPVAGAGPYTIVGSKSAADRGDAMPGVVAV
jgi:hypothetical protein